MLHFVHQKVSYMPGQNIRLNVIAVIPYYPLLPRRPSAMPHVEAMCLKLAVGQIECHYIGMGKHHLLQL